MYKIVRRYENGNQRTIDSRLTLEEAREHCRDPETSSRTATGAAARKRTRQHGAWVDGYEET